MTILSRNIGLKTCSNPKKSRSLWIKFWNISNSMSIKSLFLLFRGLILSEFSMKHQIRRSSRQLQVQNGNLHLIWIVIVKIFCLFLNLTSQIIKVRRQKVNNILYRKELDTKMNIYWQYRIQNYEKRLNSWSR